MQTMNISLPDTMRQFVEEQVYAGEYSSVSEYVRELVRADQKRCAQEALEQFLIHAMHSGEPEEITLEMVERLRSNIRDRAEGRRGGRR